MSGRTPIPVAGSRPRRASIPDRASIPGRAVLVMSWAAWFGSRSDATIHAFRNRRADPAFDHEATTAAAGAVRLLHHLDGLPGVTQEVRAIACGLLDGHSAARIPPLLASVVDASDRERAAMALLAREAAKSRMSPGRGRGRRLCDRLSRGHAPHA